MDPLILPPEMPAPEIERPQQMDVELSTPEIDIPMSMAGEPYLGEIGDSSGNLGGLGPGKPNIDSNVVSFEEAKDYLKKLSKVVIGIIRIMDRG